MNTFNAFVVFVLLGICGHANAQEWLCTGSLRYQDGDRSTYIASFEKKHYDENMIDRTWSHFIESKRDKTAGDADLTCGQSSTEKISALREAPGVILLSRWNPLGGSGPPHWQELKYLEENGTKLAKFNGCVKYENVKKERGENWFRFTNVCDEPIAVHWCNTLRSQSCDTEQMFEARIPVKGYMEDWYNYGNIGVAYFACPVSRNGKEVRSGDGHCYVMK